jgi:hypothetical protein
MKPQQGPALPHIRISVPVGDSPGEMKELPEKFSAKDVVVNLAGGGSASEGTKITIDGVLRTPASSLKEKPCWVKVDWATR